MASESYAVIDSLTSDPGLAQALGDLTIAWAATERSVFFAFWVASGVDQAKAFNIYESMSGPKARGDLIASLFELDKPSHPKFSDLIATIMTINELAKERNDFTHRTWTKNHAGEYALLDARFRRRRAEVRSITVENVRSVAERLRQASSDIMTLVQEIFPSSFGPAVETQTE